MAAWGIEEVGKDCYKVIRFPYRWQMTEWIAKKPGKRRQSGTSALDIHLKCKARTTRAITVNDTRRIRS